MLGIIPHRFPFPEFTPQTRADVLHTCIKMNQYFREHDNILVSVSGGSDSDCIVHLICKYFPEYLYKTHFVFVRVGLEYEATKRHLKDISDKYKIEIETIKGMSVVYAIKKYGVPILSKTRSEDIYYYLQGKDWAVQRVEKKTGRYGYSENMRKMIRYCKENGIKISAFCCRKSKKEPIKKFCRQNDIDLNVTGERKAEGGQRVGAHKSCFEEHTDGMHKFMPLWWWSNGTKQEFKEKEGIRYSDCYEVYGMKRTGCCGCPYSLNISSDLQVMFEHEPNLYKACMNVFGESYRLMDEFKCRKKKCLPELVQYPLEIVKEEINHDHNRRPD